MATAKRRPARWTSRLSPRLRNALVLGAAGLGGFAIVVLAWANYEISAFLSDRSFPPIRIFSAPFVLRPGLDLEGAHVFDRLRRLAYTEAAGGGLEPGTFRRRKGTLEIGLRGFQDAFGDIPPEPVRLALEGKVVAAVDRLGDEKGELRALLEPELVGTYTGGVTGERRPVLLAELPPHVVRAFLAAEDARFLSHPGIDPIGLLRAAWVNVRGGTIRQGGSTITQQLAKNTFLTPERSWLRKVREVFYAIILEVRLSKEEILETYLNTIYLGRIGSIGMYGIGAASRAFFGREPRDLEVGEAALIAGVIRSPNPDSPVRHPKRALARRNTVLDEMHENGWLDEEALAAAKKKPLGVSTRSVQPLVAPFFVDEVIRRVTELGHSPFLVRGLSVYTTVDLELQQAAERAVRGGLTELEKRYPKLAKHGQPVEGALVALDATNGFTRAMVGGRDFSRSQYNRATRSQRQPGSAFKPFVYLAAIDSTDAHVTPVSRLRDEPIRLRVGPDVWSPTNYDGEFHGDVTVRKALEQSRNVPTVVLAQHIGLSRVAELARDVGLGRVPSYPAIVLGSSEASLVDLTGAYTVFPKLGEVVRPALIRAVVAPGGEVLYRDELKTRRVATSAAAFVVSTLLEGVVDHGTAASIRRLGLTAPVAGKTGTTNDEKDSWFVGYSPDLVAGAWVGFDDATPVGLTGAEGALPVWTTFMREALATRTPRRFTVPPGVVFRDIDPESGLLGGWMCPRTTREAFIVGTEPEMSCDTVADAAPRDSWEPRRREVEPEPLEEEPFPRRTRPPGGWKEVEGWFKGVFGGR